MHGTTQAAVETRLAPKDFGQGSIEKEVTGQRLHLGRSILFHDTQAIATKKVLHDSLEVLVIQLSNRGHALGENLPVRTVGAKNMIVRTQEKCLTHSGCLLSD